MAQETSPTSIGTVPHARGLLSERQAATYLAMSTAFLRRARLEGRGPAYHRLGRAVRYGPADLQAWLDAHRIDAPRSVA